jgi:hypothetical protein
LKIRATAAALLVAGSLAFTGGGVAYAADACTDAVSVTAGAKALLDQRVAAVTSGAARLGIDAALVGQLRDVLIGVDPATIADIGDALADGQVTVGERLALVADPDIAAVLPRVLAIVPDTVGGDDVLAVVGLLRPVLDAQLALNAAVDTQNAACGTDTTVEDVAHGATPTPVVGRDDLNCVDFTSQADAQAQLDRDPSDPNRLDSDDDRLACENFFDADDSTVSEDTMSDGNVPLGSVATGGL